MAEYNMAEYNKAFRPSAPNDLTRVGAKMDGGYVLSPRMINATKGLLSFGLSDEWEFERDFVDISKAPLACFDPSVNRFFWIKKFTANLLKGVYYLDKERLKRSLRFMEYNRFFDNKTTRHIQKAIGYEGENSLSLNDALKLADLPRPIFLKMDIEGWEYRILSQIVEQRNEFVGLAIEFHDIDLHEERIIDFMSSIADRFVLIHFHANSHTTIGPDGKALVVEMTFMAKDLLDDNEELSYKPLPLPDLDAPNLPGDNEAVVSFKE